MVSTVISYYLLEGVVPAAVPPDYSTVIIGYGPYVIALDVRAIALLPI